MKFSFILTILFVSVVCRGQHDLNFFLQQAKNNSPQFRDYQNQLLAFRLDSLLIRSSNKIQVSGISNNFYAPVLKGFGYDEVITNGGNLSALIQASRTFNSRNNLASQYGAIRIQGQTIANTSKLAEQDLSRAIVAQYIIAYGDQLTLNFDQEVYDLLKKENEILKKLTERNVYRQTDYLTFFVTFQQQELTLRQAEIQYSNDYATLNYMAGIVDTTTAPLEDPALNLNTLPSIFQSIFYEKFTLDSMNYLNQRAIVDYSYKPKIGVSADAGYNSAIVPQVVPTLGASIGINVTVPIYDGRQKALKYKKIELLEKTRIANKNFYLSQYQQQVAQLTQQIRLIETVNIKINEQIKYTYALINVNEKLLSTGDVRIADYVNSINSYLTAKSLLNQNYVSRLQLINQVNYWNR